LCLLIPDPATGSARVTAWGAPGTGPTLSPYVNAVGAGAGDSLKSPTATASTSESPTANPTATSTPTPSPTPKKN